MPGAARSGKLLAVCSGWRGIVAEVAGGSLSVRMRSVPGSASLRLPSEPSPGTGPKLPLEDIARKAAIGPGTVYRQFPTRDALIEALYRSEVEKLTAAGQRFAATMQSLEARQAWMLLFIDHLASNKLILPSMDTVTGGFLRFIEGARGLIHSAFIALVQRAIDSGDLREDTEPNDFVRAVIDVLHRLSCRVGSGVPAV